MAGFAFSRLWRGLVCRFWDPVVRYDLDGRTIRLPLSHSLPLFRRVYPQYATNLTRLVSACGRKYPDLRVIDVGANGGDSAVLIKNGWDCPILCVEGDSRFHALLQANVAALKGVELANVFVGKSRQGEQLVYAETTPGSGQLVKSAEKQTGSEPAAKHEGPAPSVPTLKTLDEIVADHPAFRDAKLVKIDTDGYDLRIVMDDLEFFRRARAAIFLEYDPNLFAAQGVAGPEAFEALRQAGYQTAIAWDNIGDYLVSAELSDRRLLADLDAYYRGRSSNRYADVCVLHGCDADLAAAVREGEIEFFSRFRSRG